MRVSRWLGCAALMAAANGMAAQPACTACHQQQARDDHGHPLADARPGAPACTDCHGSPAGHPGAPGGGDEKPILAFETESVAVRSAVCLSCHRSAHPDEGSDAHRQAGVACDGCHRAHRDSLDVPAPAGLDDLDAASATCASCHQAVFARFAFNERHRLVEGALSCVSCHDPHDAGRPSALAGRSGNACGKCHDDTAGPFVFEHGASRVDGCLSCHEPHGSPNRHLLTQQQEGALCYTCHASVPQFHVGFAPGAPPRFDQDTVCTNCHTAIHGSNLDRNFLR